MPNLRVLCVEHACGPVLIGACMDAIGQLQHLEYLHLTPHPGGSPWAMSSERFHATFAPEGIKFWEEWSIVDINQRNGPRGCLRVDFFDQPRLHASLKQLDLSYWREAIEQVHVWVWPSFAKHLHKFRVLEVLDLNGVRWPERYEDAMADAMLSLPPSLTGLYLQFNAGPKGGQHWADRGVFASFGSLPALTELDMTHASLDLSPAMTLLSCCQPQVELFVTCDLFELPAGDGAAREKELKRLVAAQKRLQRQLG